MSGIFFTTLLPSCPCQVSSAPGHFHHVHLRYLLHHFASIMSMSDSFCSTPGHFHHVHVRYLLHQVASIMSMSGIFCTTSLSPCPCQVGSAPGRFHHVHARYLLHHFASQLFMSDIFLHQNAVTSCKQALCYLSYNRSRNECPSQPGSIDILVNMYTDVTAAQLH